MIYLYIMVISRSIEALSAVLVAMYPESPLTQYRLQQNVPYHEYYLKNRLKKQLSAIEYHR